MRKIKVNKVIESPAELPARNTALWDTDFWLVGLMKDFQPTEV